MPQNNPTYATRSALLAEVAQFGARLTERDDSGYDVAVEAPHGRVWNSGDVHEIVGSCPDGRQRARNLVRDDVIQRMRCGTSPCETEDCEWCQAKIARWRCLYCDAEMGVEDCPLPACVEARAGARRRMSVWSPDDGR